MKRLSKKLFFVLFTIVVFFCFTSNASANDGRRLYFLQERQSIEMIAEKEGIDVELLAAMNNISPKSILATGKRIWLPLEPENDVTVKRGDTLWDIAKRYNTTVSVIAQNNNINNVNTIHIGQNLKIPVSDSIYEPTTIITKAKNSQKITISSRGDTFIWPLRGIITSKFGKRGSGFHHGLDIAAEVGTPIAAIKGGKVIQTGWYSRIYGNMVTIKHSEAEESLYAHLSKIMVKEGDVVNKGQIIGQVGETGNATGPHLHLQISIDNKIVDPLIYLR